MIEAKRHLQGVERTAANAEPSRLGKARLDKNDRALPFGEEFLARVRAKLTSERISAYPECWPATEKVAAWAGVSPQCVQLHAGSEQAIKLIYETYVSPDDTVLLHLPGFAMYPVYSRLFQARVEAQRYGEDMRFDWDAYVARVRPGIRMVVVENPNGIVGHPAPLPVIRRLLKAAEPHGGFVVVDEAYHLFHGDSAVPLLEDHGNLVVTRSFSKAFGIAGLRAGCVISRPENIANLRKFKPSYELCSLTAMILEDLLEHPDEVARHVEEISRCREAFGEAIRALGFRTTHSAANFLTMRLGRELAETWRQELTKEDILIRQPFREAEIADWVRVSMASEDIHNRALEVLRAVLEQRPDLKRGAQ